MNKTGRSIYFKFFIFFFSNIHSQTSLPVPVIRKEEYILKRFFKVISLEQNVKLNF